MDYDDGREKEDASSAAALVVIIALRRGNKRVVALPRKRGNRNVWPSSLACDLFPCRHHCNVPGRALGREGHTREDRAIANLVKSESILQSFVSPDGTKAYFVALSDRVDDCQSSCRSCVSSGRGLYT